MVRMGATAVVALGLGLTLGLSVAEELCSLVPYSYTTAKTTYPDLAFALDTLEEYSIATWFTDRMTKGQQASTLSGLVSKCSEDTRLSVVVYGLPNKDCEGGYSGGGTVQNPSDYYAFLRQLTDAVGNRKVLYVVEPDAVGLSTGNSCGVSAGYKDNLKMAIQVLSANPNAELYLDVGYWLLAYDSTLPSVASVVKEIASAGRVKGITINTSNYRSTNECAGYCSRFQRAMGSNEMTCIIDTSRNYNGSPSTEWCNVKQGGIGKPPTSWTGVSNLDYYLWIKVPGESDGQCTGGSHTSDALQGPAAGAFFEKGFQLLWNQGYFVRERGMPTIADRQYWALNDNLAEETAAAVANATAPPTTDSPVSTTATPMTAS